MGLAGYDTTLAIGAPRANQKNDQRQHVKVYHMEGNESSWKQLSPDINREADAISVDGNTLANRAHEYWGKADWPVYMRIYHM